MTPALKRVKIGVLIDRIIPGGAEKIAIKQVQAFAELGHEATLLVLNRSLKKGVEKIPYQDIIKKVPVVYLSDRIPKYLRFTFKFPFFSFFSFFHLSYAFLIPFVVKKKEFDIIIAHGTYTCFTALSLHRRRRIPYLAFIWDPITYILKKGYPSGPLNFLRSILMPIGLYLDKKIVNNSGGLLVGGKAHDAYFRKISAKKIYVIPPSYDPVKEIPSKRGDYILAVTAWKKGKDPEFLLELIEKFPSFKLILAGGWLSMEYREEFEKEVKKRNLSTLVEVVGFVSEQALVKLYKKARFLVQANDDRGFGMPALEAAACGCPFIIPKGQGVCELFKDKIDGFYVREKDIEEISQFAELLIRKERMAFKMGRHGWKTVCKDHSWIRHAERLLKIIGLVIKERS